MIDNSASKVQNHHKTSQKHHFQPKTMILTRTKARRKSSYIYFTRTFPTQAIIVEDVPRRPIKKINKEYDPNSKKKNSTSKNRSRSVTPDPQSLKKQRSTRHSLVKSELVNIDPFPHTRAGGGNLFFAKKSSKLFF